MDAKQRNLATHTANCLGAPGVVPSAAEVQILCSFVHALVNENARLEKFARAHWGWEANLLLCDKSWNTADGLPHLTQKLYDQAVELQALRDVALNVTLADFGPAMAVHSAEPFEDSPNGPPTSPAQLPARP